MFWLACAAYRLARFNVTIDPLADKRYFVGLASPGAAGVVISTVLAIGDPLYDWAPLVPVAAGVVPAALMATSFRFRSFRDLLSPRHLRITVPLGILIALGLALFPGATGMALAYGYVLTCPLGWVTAPLRRRWFGEDAVAPPRTRMPSVIMPPDLDDEGDDGDDVDDLDDEPCR
jgi:CDP-diacylglycerol--serine O-phosphatidyltransferase